MLSCKDVSKRVSESLDYQLPFHERLGLWMHLAMCRLCRRFRKNMLHVHEVVRESVDANDTIDSSHKVVSLTDDARDRIKRKLKSLMP
jgi:hypothetical protein